jgi:hypothetical protein
MNHRGMLLLILGTLAAPFMALAEARPFPGPDHRKCISAFSRR